MTFQVGDEVPMVTLGITTYRGADLLKQCLESIRKSVVTAKYANYEVLVVDDGSPKEDADKTAEVCDNAKKGIPNLRSVFPRVNLGNVARYNTIAEAAKGDIVVLLDNDVLVPDRWFWSVLAFFLFNEKVGVASHLALKVSAKMASELLKKPRIPAVGSGRTPERATELAGYSFAFRKEHWKKIGGFDYRNFKFFAGDSDFCCRLAKEGFMSYRLLYPQIYHHEHATYDKWTGLQASSRMKVDLSHFKMKHGKSPKVFERELLKTFPPRELKYYANYVVHTSLDQENLESFKLSPIIVVPKSRDEKNE